MTDIAAIIALQIVVQLEGGDIRLLSQLVLDEEVCLPQLLLSTLELQKFLYAKDVAAFEHGLGCIVNQHIAVRRELLSQKLDADTKLLLKYSLQFLTAAALVTILLQDGP